MKKQLLVLILTLAMGTAAKAVKIDYSSTSTTGISFDGSGHFNFSPVGNNFLVTDGLGVGDLGSISGPVGGFTIGTITTSGVDQMASVTGTGTLTITGHGGTLSATLTWVDIFTHNAAGGLNDIGSANLSGITFVGAPTAADGDLVALAAKGAADNVLTFQFGSGTTLTDLKTSANSTSFSGSIATPDGGTTVMLLGSALTGLAIVRRTIKSKMAKA